MDGAYLEGKPFDLFLFHRDVELSCHLLESGVGAVIIDLESRGKNQRQAGFDTEINAHTADDLRSLRAKTACQIFCRVSGPDVSDSELTEVINSGADEIIIPMVRHVAEVERVLRVLKDRCRVTVMIETQEAADQAHVLGRLPIERIYVGLNDLHIDRGTDTIFAPLVDGYLDRIREQCRDVTFGFGGLTLPDLGAPLAARHLYAEMARLDCSFTFLRRSFYRDMAGKDSVQELSGMQSVLRGMQMRTPQSVSVDQQDLRKALLQINRQDM
ncbi:MAG: hypothetical protein WA790_16760 [Sulfitobacter sp.]